MIVTRLRVRDFRSYASAEARGRARHGVALRDDRASAVRSLEEGFAAAAAELGLAGAPALRYRPRSSAATAEELAAELATRLDGDLERGFTGHGPHRDDLGLLRDGRELRVYGSQGEQRLALLALLLAERLAPHTLLAAVQRAWPDAVGDGVAAQAEPTAERDGVVTVTCSSAVWAQELDLMAPDLVARLNTALGAESVRALRCRATPPRGWRG